MALHVLYPNVLLVPTADIALMWHTHMGLSAQYAAACGSLFGEAKPSQLWRPTFLELGPQQWWQGYAATKAMYETQYGELECEGGKRGGAELWLGGWCSQEEGSGQMA